MFDDARNTTTNMEKGYGCDLQNLVKEIPDLKERTQILNDIVELNKQDRSADASVPVLTIESFPKSTVAGSAAGILANVGVHIGPQNQPERAQSQLLIRETADGHKTTIYSETWNSHTAATSRCTGYPQGSFKTFKYE